MIATIIEIRALSFQLVKAIIITLFTRNIEQKRENPISQNWPYLSPVIYGPSSVSWKERVPRYLSDTLVSQLV